VKGLKILHELNYIHNDLKPDNILVFTRQEQGEEKFFLKLTNFGMVVDTDQQFKEVDIRGFIFYFYFF
jgi:serine/threonine protein kinase